MSREECAAAAAQGNFLLEAHKNEKCEPRLGAGLSLRPPPGRDQIRELFRPPDALGNEAQQTASGGLLPQNEESVRVGVSAL